MKAVKKFTDEFRWKVVQEVLSGQISKCEANRKYGIRGSSQITYWIRKFSGIKNPRKPERAIPLPDMKNKDKEEIKILQQENQKLERALETVRLKAEALETMLEIAKEDLNIDIRKKYGAKQLKDLKATIQK